jgi:hypothetical protein
MTDNNPHPVDENPESFIGEATADPWDDDSQTDWPSETIDVPEVTE